MGLFLRFGEIPKNERSINFLKLTLNENDNFQDDVSILGYDEAVDRLPEHAFEDGVSCFALDSDGKPILDSMRLLRSFAARIDTEKCYMIEADQVAAGNDDEPLVKNIKILRESDMNRSDMIDLVLEILKSNFANVKHTDPASDSANLFEFHDHADKACWTFHGWEFSECISDIDVSLGVKRK